MPTLRIRNFMQVQYDGGAPSTRAKDFPYRKLKLREDGSFRRLSAGARALHKQLLIECDEFGQMLVTEDVGLSVCRIVGAYPAERRWIRRSVEELITAGHLILEVGSDDGATEGRPADDRGATDARPRDDRGTTEARPDYESTSRDPACEQAQVDRSKERRGDPERARETKDQEPGSDPSHALKQLDLFPGEPLPQAVRDALAAWAAALVGVTQAIDEDPIGRRLLERTGTKDGRAVVLKLWDRQEELRTQVVPGASLMAADETRLTRIADRLAEGASVTDCEKVLHVVAAEASARAEAAIWFNGVSHWEKKSFDRARGRSVAVVCGVPSPTVAPPARYSTAAPAPPPEQVVPADEITNLMRSVRESLGYAPAAKGDR